MQLTTSKTYNAGSNAAATGKGSNGQGISIRFPRFVRARPDKTADAARAGSSSGCTSTSQLADMMGWTE